MQVKNMLMMINQKKCKNKSNGTNVLFHSSVLKALVGVPTFGIGITIPHNIPPKKIICSNPQPCSHISSHIIFKKFESATILDLQNNI